MDMETAIELAGLKADAAAQDIEFYDFCAERLAGSGDARMLDFIGQMQTLMASSAEQHLAIKQALAEL